MKSNAQTPPSGWQIQRLLDIVELPSALVDPREPKYQNLPLLAPNHIESGTGRWTFWETAVEQGARSGKYLFAPGDVVYSKIRPYLRKAACVTCKGICSADMYPLRPRPVLDPRFLLALLLSDSFTAFATSVSTRTGIPKINRTELGEFWVALPPLPEQRKIAAILASVDETLEKTAAVIHQLENFKEVKKRELLPTGRHSCQACVILESVTESLSGGTPDRSDPRNFGGHIPWVKSGEVASRSIASTEETLTHRGLNNSAAKICPAGSVLVAMYGATAGKVGRLAVEAATNQAILALIPRADKITAEFLYYRLIASAETLLGRTQGSGQPNLNAGLIRSLEFPLPPVEKQISIGRMLSAFDDNIEAEVAVLFALQQLKSSLVTALLSGQIRVTPDEAIS